MKHLWSAAVALVAMAMALPSSAEWRYWRGSPEDNHDWTNPKNFDGEVAPQVGDYIVVVKGLEVWLDPSDTASWALLNNASTHVQLQNSGSFVIIDSDDDVTFEGSISTAWDDIYFADRDNGGIKKRGSGLLTLRTSVATYGYYTGLFVEGGSLKLDIGSGQTIGVLSVNEGCIAELTASLTLAGFVGAGTIMRMQEANQDYIAGPGVYAFSGQLVGNITPWFQNKQLLTCETMSLEKIISARGNRDRMLEGPYLGVKVFGTPDEPSSVGLGNHIMLNEDGGIRYLGTGETTTKNIKVGTTVSGHAFLDGGETGGLVWNGNLVFDAWRNQQISFIFTGDHTTPCVFGGYCFDEWNGYKRLVYITKDGTGTWRFTGNKEQNGNDFAGIAVKNGTLQFDSIAEKGTNSSLGKASKTTEDYSGGDSADAHLVPYAYVLGGHGDALMEYTGTAAAKVTTRPAVLDGTGGFKSSAAAFDFTGVTAKGTGVNTLLLDGDTVVNTVRDVTDGAGVVGIEKRGGGTWVLEGNNAFSGPVAVKAGTLRIASAAKPYRWYRFNIKELQSDPSTLTCFYLGFYDKDGRSLTDGFAKGTSAASLAAGQAFYWGSNKDFYVDAESVYGKDLASFFAFNSDCWGGYFLKDRPNWKTQKFKADDETTWARVLVRLPDDAAPVVAYDFLMEGGAEWRSKYGIKTWSLDASVDGQTWTEVSATTTKASSAGAWGKYWAGNGAYQDGFANPVHKTGMSIASSVVVGTLPTTTAWSVDEGATIVNENETPLAVERLDVDAAKGLGTLVNFAFAADGVLALSNHTLEKAGDSIALTGDFSETTGFANVAGWTLLVDGVETSRYGFAVSGNTITFTRVKKPVVLILR